MKIPTLVGLTLIIAILVSIGLYVYFQKTEVETKLGIEQLQPVNVFANSATIVWQTDIPVIGQVVFGESENLNQLANDNRDRNGPVPRFTHFVTMNNLKGNTKYFYKIKNDNILYPEKIQGLTTAMPLPDSDDLTFSFIKPLKGTILNTNINPIDEALIFLQIPGAEPMATFSSTAGNFILPLKTVYNPALDQLLIIPENTVANLNIVKGNLSSNVKISLSPDKVTLPPITIGTNLDLTNYEPQQIGVISMEPGIVTNLDFNNDKKINSLDLAILRGQVGKNLSGQELIKYDLNSDKVIDQKDIAIFSANP